MSKSIYAEYRARLMNRDKLIDSPTASVGVRESTLKKHRGRTADIIRLANFNKNNQAETVWIVFPVGYDDRPNIYKTMAIFTERKPDYLKSGSGEWTMTLPFKSGLPMGTYVFRDIRKLNTILSKKSAKNIYLDQFKLFNEKIFPWLVVTENNSKLKNNQIVMRCNYILKWRDKNSSRIINRYAVIDDDYNVRDGVFMTKGGSKLPNQAIPIILPRDEETINIRRGNRFLIDDKRVEDNPAAYITTSRSIIFSDWDAANNELSSLTDMKGNSPTSLFDISLKFSDKHPAGLVNLVVSEQQFNPATDSKEFMVADYFGDNNSKDKPSDTASGTAATNNLTLKIESLLNSSNSIVVGSKGKDFGINFYFKTIKPDADHNNNTNPMDIETKVSNDILLVEVDGKKIPLFTVNGEMKVDVLDEHKDKIHFKSSRDIYGKPKVRIWTDKNQSLVGATVKISFDGDITINEVVKNSQNEAAKIEAVKLLPSGQSVAYSISRVVKVVSLI